MQLPDSIMNQYAKYPDRIIKLQVIIYKKGYIVLVEGKTSLKVHHWIYNNGWRLDR